MVSPIVHFQLASSDPAATAAFVHDVFGWETGDGPGATIGINTGEPHPGDIRVAGSILALPAGAPHYTAVYVRVDDLDGALKKAQDHGATVVLPRTDTPDGPTIALISSPQGHIFGLVQQ